MKTLPDNCKRWQLIVTNDSTFAALNHTKVGFFFFAEKNLEIKKTKALHDHKSSPYKSGVVKESVQIVV